MIKVNNVVKTFDGFRALDGLTMEVEKGSIYGLVGPNGAGKSTILRHITGIYRPDSGTITVDGAAGVRKSGGEVPGGLHPRRPVLLSVRLHPGHDEVLPGAVSRL